MTDHRRRFDLRLTDGERDAFQRAADASGLSTSEWLRQLARAASGLRTVADDLACTDKSGDDR